MMENDHGGREGTPAPTGDEVRASIAAFAKRMS
jgi:hypothetical protein